MMLRPLLALVVVAWIGAATASEPPPKDAPERFAGDDVEMIISRCGQPDAFQSTQNDVPRPPNLTMFLEYKKAGVRFIFFATDGKPHPPHRWKLLGPQDLITLKPIHEAERVSRMPCTSVR